MKLCRDHFAGSRMYCTVENKFNFYILGVKGVPSDFAFLSAKGSLVALEGGSSVDDFGRITMEGSRVAPNYTYAAGETFGMAASSCWSFLGGFVFQIFPPAEFHYMRSCLHLCSSTCVFENRRSDHGLVKLLHATLQ